MGNPIDLTGCKFGRLTVLERDRNAKDGKAKWLCKCDCGNEKSITGSCLRSGHTKSCGCLNKEITSKNSFIDRTGERFGRLVVISRADDYVAHNGKHHVMWNCKCDCGNITTVDVVQLVGGKTKSCGCLRAEKSSITHFKHGGRHDRLYKVYHNMKNRCYNVNADDYKYYGDRGIIICDEWLDSYQAFKNWAYSSGYDDTAEQGQCTIDRIDVNGIYEPNNCRWVDMATQSRNRRNVKNKNDNSPRKDTLRTETELAGAVC